MSVVIGGRPVLERTSELLTWAAYTGCGECAVGTTGRMGWVVKKVGWVKQIGHRKVGKVVF